jgi:hypothetical protein
MFQRERQNKSHVLKIITFLFAISVLGFVQTTSAAPIFSDNFDSENLGLNYSSFANWTVSDGTVDLIGNPGFFDFIPGNGRYVDLDGSTGNAGKMTSTALNLNGGQNYNLTFDLSGSQRGDTNSLVYGIDLDSNGILDFSNSISLGSNSALTTFSLIFNLSASTSNASIVFDLTGGDNFGLLLDNVDLNASNVSSVPVPAAIWLFSSALIGLSATRRRLTSINS